MSHTKELPLDELKVSGGGMYDPSQVTALRFVPWKLLEGWAGDIRQRYGLKSQQKDRTRVCLLAIDNQNCFCHPDGELYVAGATGTGAVDDSRRIVEFIYRNLGYISELHCTLDTHRAYAIFHSSFLLDEDGQHPADFTQVSVDDVRAGKWRPSPFMCSALGLSLAAAHRYLEYYCNELEKAGRYTLTIWPYHGMMGSEGHALVSGLQEAAFVHAIARGAQTGFEVKGTNPLTENYSVLGPEVLVGPTGKPIAQRNVAFLRKLLEFDAVIIVGQAKSHCVAWTIDDLLETILKQDPALARKIYLMQDCTTPIVTPYVDFTEPANKAFREFEDAGMHLVKSTDPMHMWPGLSGLAA